MDFTYHLIVGATVSRIITGEYSVYGSVAAVFPDLIGTTYYQYLKCIHSSRKSPKRFLEDFRNLTTGGKFFGKADRILYQSTHSLFALLPVGIVSYLIFHDYWLVITFGYLSHCVVDFFSHNDDFSQKPFYPMLNFSFKGFGWYTNKKLFVLAWLILVSVLLLQLIWKI